MIGDYFARHVGLPAEVAEQQLATKLRGVLIADRMSEHAVRQIFAERPRGPPLGPPDRDPVPRAGHPRWPEERAGERRARRAVAVVAPDGASSQTIADAGHDLWSRDVDAYLAVLLPFLARVTGG